MDELLSKFYRTIDETSNNVVGQGVTGVLFVAVCRGKVSEGLDFADKNARTVVTVSFCPSEAIVLSFMEVGDRNT